LRKAALDAGASVKLIAPKIGGVKTSDGAQMAVDGQLAGTPSILFDAVAVLLGKNGDEALRKESAALDFVRDAYGHLKAIALDAGGRRLIEAAGLAADEAVFDAKDRDGFIAAAKTRLWAREPRVRTLA